jgi:hypothetical protein
VLVIPHCLRITKILNRLRFVSFLIKIIQTMVRLNIACKVSGPKINLYTLLQMQLCI